MDDAPEVAFVVDESLADDDVEEPEDSDDDGDGDGEEEDDDEEDGELLDELDEPERESVR